MASCIVENGRFLYVLHSIVLRGGDGWEMREGGRQKGVREEEVRWILKVTGKERRGSGDKGVEGGKKGATRPEQLTLS